MVCWDVPKTKKDIEREKEINDAWRAGYDLGVKSTIKDNDLAIRIGNAIVDALDDRYAFAKDYD